MTTETMQLVGVKATDVERATGVFQRMPSIPRLMRDVIVTEKIDGTNASIFIDDYGVQAASRSRWITPQDDNYGFAGWVARNEQALRDGLGIGHHFGEWFGSGIQRKYGLSGGDKRFALFNVSRWAQPEHTINLDFFTPAEVEKQQAVPDVQGLTVVPIIARGVFDTRNIMEAAAWLQKFGSVAVPGFDKPEGIVVYHTKADALFKYTFDKNDGHKGGE